MAITTQQISERLLKKSQGVVDTKYPLSVKGITEEGIGTYSLVRPNDIWAEADSIPTTPPVLASGATSGVVKFYEKLSLQMVDAGTTTSFKSPNSETADMITGKFAFGYIPKIFDNTGNIPIYGGDWVVDAETGVLTFYNISETINGGGAVVSNANPPKISFYKYVGKKGFETSVSGVLSCGPITSVVVSGNTNGVVNISSIQANFNSNADFSGNINTFNVPALNGLQLVANQYTYITAQYNNGTPQYVATTDNNIINHSTVLNIVQLYWENVNSINEIHTFYTGTYGLGLSNKIGHRLLHTERFGYEGGLILGEYGTRNISISSGRLWYDGEEIDTLSVSGGTAGHEAHFYYPVAGVFTASKVTQYPNTQYSDGTNLVNLTGNKFTNIFVWKCVNSTDRCNYIMLGNEYNSIADALVDKLPSIIPDVITKQGKFVGRIVIGNGQGVASQITSELTNVIGQTPVTNHNSLSNLQGGTTNEYYHLTNEQVGKIDSLESTYLPLTGGTLTGKLTSNIPESVVNNTTSFRQFQGDLTRYTGGTSTVTEGIYQNTTYSGTTNVSGVYGINLFTRNLNSATVSNLYGVQAYTRNDGVGKTTNIVGGYFSTRNNTTGSFNKMLGMQSLLTNNSSDVTNNDMYGMSTSLTNGPTGFTDSMAGITSHIYNNGTVNESTGVGVYFPAIGTVNSSIYGLKVGSSEHPWVGSAPNMYGLYIHGSISGGTINNYGIYSDTIAKNYLKGGLGIKMLPTNDALSVSGDTLVYGNISGTTFYGSGAGLTDIPASGVTGLDLDRITSGSNSAIMSSSGLTVNTGITATSFITSGGTSSQFVRGDGSLDSATYSKEPLSITYADLYNLTQTSGLTVGQRYIINDYQTIYTQPISNVLMSGTTEPLLVEALTTSKLKNECYSTLFPQDIIYYDIESNQTMVPGCTKGYIYRRIDTVKNNDIGFDYRQVKFRRWQLNVTTEDADGDNNSYYKGDVVKKTGTNEVYIKINNVQGLFDDVSKWKRYEFDNLSYILPQDGDWYFIMGPYQLILPNSGLYFDYYMFSTAPTISGVQSSFNNIYKNKFSGNNSNIISNSNSVLFGNSFYSNTIGDNFRTNAIGNDFYYNTIGNDFRTNTIGNSFYYNTIGNNFYNNAIGNGFNYNTIGYSFTNNTILDFLYYNTIGNDLSYNIIGYYSYYDTIGNNFNDNTIGYNFYDNTIGNNFNNNTIGNNFRKNNIESNVSSINFVSPLSVYVYLDYQKYIFNTSTGTTKLRYYDGNNTLQITNANA